MGVPQELYPSVGDAGLLIFNEYYPLGTDVREIFGFDDHIVDFEILANRPDCLSVWGVARETAAAMGTALSLPEITVDEMADGDIHDCAKVDVLDSELCPRYAARVVKNVRLAPSPMWLRHYLHAAGMRSINNIVDITNFVMLETGHPMHAFDLDKVKNRHIIVRRAANGESITTLDGKKHDLNGTELAICDEDGPTGLAGVMGGEESEITENTREILFECATFDRASIRVTSRRLGIRTESSGRFERGVAAQTVMTGLERACQMINILDAGDVVPGVIDIYPNPVHNQPIVCSVKRICARAGVDVPGEKMVEILEKLLFTVTLSGDTLTATAPDFRQDVDTDADICEEVLRFAGYELIPSTPMVGVAAGGKNMHTRQADAMRTLLTGMGYFETMTFSFIARKKLEQLNLAQGDARLSPIALLNPLGEDTAVMRTTLLCGVLSTVQTNLARGNAAGRIYELGKVFDGKEKTTENLPLEKRALCLAAWGEKEDFFSIRTSALTLLDRLGIEAKIEASDEPCLHPGRRAKLTANGKMLAVIGECHPDVMANYDLSDRVYLAQIDVDALFEESVPMGHVKAPARYPAVSRDIALVMGGAQPVGPVMDEMKKACGKMLEDIALFDVFRGVQLGEGKKSVAFSLTFRAEDHTLTEEEIVTLMQKAQKAAKEKFDAVIRS